MIKKYYEKHRQWNYFFLENDGENTPDINTYMYIFVQ